MHQSIPAAAKQPPPPLPPRYCGAFARLVSPGGGVFANFVLPGGRAFANPGDISERLTSKRFPISILLHKGFYWERKQIGSSVMDMKKLERFVKACSWFCACISSLLIKPELQAAKSATINENQRFLVIESNFCWYYLKNILFILVKLFTTYNFRALY